MTITAQVFGWNYHPISTHIFNDMDTALMFGSTVMGSLCDYGQVAHVIVTDPDMGDIIEYTLKTPALFRTEQ